MTCNKNNYKKDLARIAMCYPHVYVASCNIGYNNEQYLKALKEARALGDLSENADYDAARAEQAQVEGRIQELEKIMENAHIIKKGSTDKVSLGTTVKIKYVDDDDIEEYRIVGSKEADPSNNKISNESPIAMAIMKAKAG